MGKVARGQGGTGRLRESGDLSAREAVQRCKSACGLCKGERRNSKGAPWWNRMIGLGAYDRSKLSGFRSPFERMRFFGWRVAAPGGRWRVGLITLGQPRLSEGAQPYHESTRAARGADPTLRRLGRDAVPTLPNHCRRLFRDESSSAMEGMFSRPRRSMAQAMPARAIRAEAGMTTQRRYLSSSLIQKVAATARPMTAS